jgi:hypothetical protein
VVSTFNERRRPKPRLLCYKTEKFGVFDLVADSATWYVASVFLFAAVVDGVYS